jgi:hypothetical protein
VCVYIEKSREKRENNREYMWQAVKMGIALAVRNENAIIKE